MTARHIILGPEDLERGLFCTVHSGEWRSCACRELYADLKGIPLAVQAVSLPYAMVLVVPSGEARILDVRVVELCRVQDGYVDAFRALAAPRKEPDCQGA